MSVSAQRMHLNRSRRALGHSRVAAIYARVSSKEQEEGFSIDAQLDLLRAYAAENGFGAAEEFVDVETAKKAGRTNFGRMIKFIKSCREPVTILAEKTDRVYRNLPDYTKLDELVKERDTRICLVKEHERIARDSGSHAHLVHGMKVLIAKNYVDNLSEEVTKGQMKKAELGQYPSCPPIGYRWDREKRSMVPHPVEAPHIKSIFGHYATGLYSLAKVADMANEEGFRTRAGHPIGRRAVEIFIKNPLYYGDFYWRGKLYKGKFESVVDRDLWEAANQQLRRRNRPNTYHKLRLPYRGLVRCAKCGSAVTAEIKKGKYVYLHCTRPETLCHREFVRKEDFEAQLQEGLGRIHAPDDMALLMQKVLDEADAERTSKVKVDTTALEAKINELKKRLDRLYSDHVDGKIDEAFFLEKWNGWKAELTKAESDIALSAESPKEARKHMRQVIELCNRVKSLFEMGNPDKRSRMARIVLSNLALEGRTLRYDYRFPYNLLVENGGGDVWRRGRDSNPHGFLGPRAPHDAREFAAFDAHGQEGADEEVEGDGGVARFHAGHAGLAGAEVLG